MSIDATNVEPLRGYPTKTQKEPRADSSSGVIEARAALAKNLSQNVTRCLMRFKIFDGAESMDPFTPAGAQVHLASTMG